MNRRTLLTTGAAIGLSATAGCLSKNSEAGDALNAYRVGHEYYQDAKDTTPNVSETPDSEEPPLFREAADLFRQAQNRFSEAKEYAEQDRAKKIAQVASEKSALKAEEANFLAQDKTTQAITRSQLAGDRRLASISEFENAVNNSYLDT